jgi:hypothetical protein
LIRKAFVVLGPLAVVAALSLIPVASSAGDQICQPGRPHTKAYCKTRCKVPKLRGKTVRQARVLLRKHDCSLGRVVKQKGNGVRVGRILRTSPKAGAIKTDGYKVRVFIRKRSHHR